MPSALREATFAEPDAGRIFGLLLPFVIIAPLAEEIFFRGIILHEYLKRYSPKKAIWVSAILFTVFHLNPWQAVFALPLGIWYAAMTLSTGSTLPGMVSHAIVNFTAYYFLGNIVNFMGYSQEQIAAGQHYPFSVLALGVLLTTLGGIVLRQQLKA